MKSNSGIVLAVLLTGTVAFFLGAIFARVFPDGDPKPLSDLLIAAVGAFAGTAAGAWIALSGDRTRRQRETEDRHVEAANVAIFTLAQIYAYVWSYSEQIIKPRRSNPRRWWEISRSVLLPPILEPFDIGRLAFLLETVHMNLPNRLSVEFNRYQALLDIIRRASEINDQIQKLARDQRRDLDGTDFLAELCNDATRESLQRHTDSLIEHNELSMPAVMEAAMSLRNAMLAMYPGRIIVQFVQPTNSDTGTAKR